jgi:hypothetical protein
MSAGQALALGLVDEVAMDVVPVVFGRRKPYFGTIVAQQLLEDSDGRWVASCAWPFAVLLVCGQRPP